MSYWAHVKMSIEVLLGKSHNKADLCVASGVKQVVEGPQERLGQEILAILCKRYLKPEANIMLRL